MMRDIQLMRAIQVIRVCNSFTVTSSVHGCPIGVCAAQYQHWLPSVVRAAAKSMAIGVAWRIQVSAL